MDFNYFVTTTEHLEQRLKEVSLDNPDHRDLIISAIERLVKDYVIPAMKVCPLHTDSIYTFNIDAVVETEIHHLMIGLFERDIEELVKPNDEELNRLLNMIGVTNTTLEQRENFFKAWAGEKAVESIGVLAESLLFKQNQLMNSVVLDFEHNRILDLLKLKLPESVLSRLKLISATNYETVQ